LNNDNIAIDEYKNLKKKFLIDIDEETKNECFYEDDGDADMVRHLNCDFYVKKLIKKEIIRFVTYANISKYKIFSRGLSLFNANKIWFIGYNRKRCRFLFKCNQYNISIKVAKAAIIDKLVNSWDITEVTCECPYEEICKHISGSLMHIKDDEYQVSPMTAKCPFKVCFFSYMFALNI